MKNPEITKAERRVLRDLVGLAWEKELSIELTKLEADFSEWRAGTCSAFDLNDKIHKFHNGTSREVYNTYSGNDLELMTASAVNRGVLSKEDVPVEILAKLSWYFETFRALAGDG